MKRAGTTDPKKIKAATRRLLIGLILGAAAAVALGCESKEQAVNYRAVADGLRLIISADREVYTSKVIKRLKGKKGYRVSEHWRKDEALPLPAQMMRMGAERVVAEGLGVSYSLLSRWPINKKNKPRSAVEKLGLKVVQDSEANYYASELIAGKEYFTAFYPDVAVEKVCAECHNEHRDSPRKDFKQGDVMGAVVIRIDKDAFK